MGQHCIQWRLSPSESQFLQSYSLGTSALCFISHSELEGSNFQVLKPRLQYFGHLMRREDSLEKTLMLGKCEGKRRRG